jgi:hypothetical protein
MFRDKNFSFIPNSKTHVQSCVSFVLQEKIPKEYSMDVLYECFVFWTILTLPLKYSGNYKFLWTLLLEKMETPQSKRLFNEVSVSPTYPSLSDISRLFDEKIVKIYEKIYNSTEPPVVGNRVPLGNCILLPHEF